MKTNKSYSSYFIVGTLTLSVEIRMIISNLALRA